MGGSRGLRLGALLALGAAAAAILATAADAGKVIDECEARIRAAVPIATRIYVEPAAPADA